MQKTTVMLWTLIWDVHNRLLREAIMEHFFKMNGTYCTK